MAIILDVLIILLFVLGAVRGYKKGFVKSLYKIFGVLISLVSSVLFYKRVSVWILNMSWYKKFFSGFEEKLYNMLSGNSGADFGKLISDKSDNFTKIIESFGRSAEEVESKYNELASGTAESIKNGILEYIVSPVAQTISRIIAFIGIFIVTMLVLFLISCLLDGVSKLPGLKSANKILGLFTGIISAALQSFIFCAVAKILIPYLSKVNSGVPADLIEKTVILKEISAVNPLDFLTSIF